MSSIDVLAGIVASDGHIYKNGLTFCIVNKDLEFIGKSAIPLIKDVCGKAPIPKFVNSGFSDGKYKITVSSVNLIRNLEKDYGIPAGAKSAALKPPELKETERKIDFLGGWVAGDGSVTHDRGRPKIEIWSNSLGILKWFRTILDEISIESLMFYEKNKKRYILRVGKKKSVHRFHERISIPHPKKQEKLDVYIKNMAQDQCRA